MSFAQPISVKDFRDNLSTIIEEVAVGKKSYTVTKFGKEKVAIIPIDKALNTKPKKNIDWDNEPFVGMWKDRKDMKDSVAWVRNLRKKNNRYSL